ncbi:alpha/beta fold hydrolase [Kiritimatiella glycovorans]|uniref:Haloalkane dehalogenase n=1 Tax=Kiritimatiella glycovorans TaxID=1307763 RepID=A0A0G3EHS1_9BACT|nr:alpha/beta fold hydrolase [Kiritimatiella glycovorans]AKJ63739.1 Haloalkane dehalogenase [Kiritimatiella glycovorans]
MMRSLRISIAALLVGLLCGHAFAQETSSTTDRFRQLDRDRDRKLSRDEVAAIAGLRRLFARLDADGDGNLSEEERSRFPRLKTRLKGADRNGDGAVSFDEFRMHIAGWLAPVQHELRAGRLAPGKHLRVVQVGDLERRYRVHVPKSYDGAKPVPVVLAFHGGGGNPGSMVRLSGLNAKSDEAGFVVVYPYGSGRDPNRGLTFNAGNVGGYAMHQNIDDVAFTSALLDDLADIIHMDENRVFATGISNGGMMAYRVASELSDRIAAIAPVGGPMGTAECNPASPVSVIHFHGTADELAPFNGGRGKGTSNVPAAMRPEFFSVEHSINCWVEANGCAKEPTVTPMPDTADDGMRVIRKVWGGGKNGSEVVLYEIEGGGHTWPGMEPPAAMLGESTKDISANDLMWDFFRKHARKADRPRNRQKAPGNGAMELLRTPDEHFAKLPDYPFEPRYLHVDDPNLPEGNRRIRMHYAVSGPADRPTLLMLHGNPSWSYLFRKVVPLINDAGYRTIMIDYVGHGKSDKPSCESDYTYDRHLEWIYQAFKQLDDDPELGLNQVVLLGHDYGHPLGALGLPPSLGHGSLKIRWNLRVPDSSFRGQRPAPVVLFSHGLGGSREGSAYLGYHWATRGYAAVFLQHPGSDTSVWKDQPMGKRMSAMNAAASGKNFMLRVKDVPAVLDQLETWNRSEEHALAGRLDMEKVGMSGHSFGAVTTQAVSGQTFMRRPLFTDARIDAAVVMSPSSPRAGSATGAFGHVATPFCISTPSRFRSTPHREFGARKSKD